MFSCCVTQRKGKVLYDNPEQTFGLFGVFIQKCCMPTGKKSVVTVTFLKIIILLNFGLAQNSG